MKVDFSIAKTSFYYKKSLRESPNWHLIYRYKCSSTENQLTKYLKEPNFEKFLPLAIFAREQLKGVGQNGKIWISPPGGIWVSAAYPIFSQTFSTDIFPISIAYFLCEMLLQESIEAKIKWPNDIYYGSKKLIGFLPRLITRGNEILYARIGISMNLNNITPHEGISLSSIYNKRKLSQSYWASQILKAIYKSVLFNQHKKHIVYGANKFLNKSYLPKGYDNSWSIEELDQTGGLVIFKNGSQKIIRSHF